MTVVNLESTGGSLPALKQTSGPVGPYKTQIAYWTTGLVYLDIIILRNQKIDRINRVDIK